MGDRPVHLSAGFVKVTGNGGSLERGGILEPGKCTYKPSSSAKCGSEGLMVSRFG